MFLFHIYYIKKKQYWGTDFSKINKCGEPDKAVVGEIFSKRIRKTPCLLETSEYVCFQKRQSKIYESGMHTT